LSSSSSPFTTSPKVAASSSTIGSDSNAHSDNPKSNREITEYANVVEKFLSHYYPAMRNAPDPKEVDKVVLEIIDDSVVFTRQGANNNFYRYPVSEDAKLYADVKRKMSNSELHSFVAKRILS
jgi:pantothenate kinase-related protein Tda10